MWAIYLDLLINIFLFDISTNPCEYKVSAKICYRFVIVNLELIHLF
nr:MAG TPA: hypothetical protein [Siphoviridae sp. ctuK76]